MRTKIMNYFIDSFIRALIGESFNSFSPEFKESLLKVENGIVEEE